MRPSLLSRRPLLFTAFAALVAFASPGVDVQPAAAAGQRSASSQCGAGAASQGGADAEIEAFLAELRRDTTALPAADGSPEVVVLNNRGYNYSNARRGIALDAIRAEAAGAR